MNRWNIEVVVRACLIGAGLLVLTLLVVYFLG
jgi:hypothetical protein